MEDPSYRPPVLYFIRIKTTSELRLLLSQLCVVLITRVTLYMCVLHNRDTWILGRNIPVVKLRYVEFDLGQSYEGSVL